MGEGDKDRRRDLEIKPSEYAKAGIVEYWIVDPMKQEVSDHLQSRWLEEAP